MAQLTLGAFSDHWFYYASILTTQEDKNMRVCSNKASLKQNVICSFFF